MFTINSFMNCMCRPPIHHHQNKLKCRAYLVNPNHIVKTKTVEPITSYQSIALKVLKCAICRQKKMKTSQIYLTTNTCRVNIHSYSQIKCFGNISLKHCILGVTYDCPKYDYPYQLNIFISCSLNISVWAHYSDATSCYL